MKIKEYKCYAIKLILILKTILKYLLLYKIIKINQCTYEYKIKIVIIIKMYGRQEIRISEMKGVRGPLRD